MHPVILLLLSSITIDWVWLLIFTRFLDHTQRRTTVGRTPLKENIKLTINLQLSISTHLNGHLIMKCAAVRQLIYKGDGRTVAVECRQQTDS